MSDLAESWFDEAKRLKFDQALMIQMLNKKEQKAFEKELIELNNAYALIDPVHSSQIVVISSRKDGRLWVIVTRKSRAPLKGLIKNKDGSYSEVKIDPQRRRMLTLMIRDGLSMDEIEESIGPLSDEEEKEFFS